MNSANNTEVTARLIAAAIRAQCWDRVGELIYLQEVQEHRQLFDEIYAAMLKLRGETRND